MNKLSLALALGTGFTLGSAVLAPARTHAAATSTTTATPVVQELSSQNISASQFNSLFKPIDNAPPLVSGFQFMGSPSSGTVRSQVFQGQAGTAAEGLTAYAYQVSVNNVSSDLGEPVSVQAASWQFNSTPMASNLTGTSTYSYNITDGAVGGLTVPQAGTDSGIRSVSSLSWKPGDKIGSLIADFVDPSATTGPLKTGADSATFVVISSEKFTQKFAGILSENPTSIPPVVYAANDGKINPIPVPEPATILAWAGMAGAVVLGRKFRKSRNDA